MGKADLGNHAGQLNPNNDAYWQSRGWDERPEDSEERDRADDGRQINNRGQSEGSQNKLAESTIEHPQYC